MASATSAAATADGHRPTPSPAPRGEPYRNHSSLDRRNLDNTGVNYNHVSYSDSWAADMQNYRTAKSTLPWLQEQHQQPVKYVTRYEKSREEREYDIVLGRYRENDKESRLQEREAIQRKHNLENSRANQLRTLQRFNMINNQPMYPGAMDPKEKQKQHPNLRKSGAEYNIVTNVPLGGAESHCPAPPGTDSRRPVREFNILTNQYHDRHEDRFEREATQAKQQAAQKFLKTRAFDPIRSIYNDEDREKEFQIRRQKEEQEHGKDRVFKLPPREQFSEGRVYNILNQRVINSSKLAAMNVKDQRALNKMQKAAFEKRMREEGEAIKNRETDRCLNRFAHERHTESQLHGYDVLSNQSYAGREAKHIAPARTHAPLSGWQTIESGLLVSNKVAQNVPSTAAAVSSNQTDAATPQAGRKDLDTRGSNILTVDQSSGAAPQSPQAIVRTGGFHA
ncbi:hypothetical protein PHYBOEH_009985 [Phytophthora boehmeriae]|uniref:Uncharacterized protein n=1 Tax=Phytophthora boehmeriae TaxID=109152 RepID=A0A8T1WY41_9STRA|nr:hypothetical protein PHYBOEH_009985 [Phytophthora boehmeriae]